MKLLSALLPRRVRDEDPHAYSVLSFAQEGEDRILMRLLEHIQHGYYVDVGAHHPQRFSNTQAFYLRGWRGINIDPAPGMRALFNRLRPHDTNLELAAGEPGTRTYYRFAESALNGFDRDLSEQRHAEGHLIVERLQVPTVPLRVLLERYMPLSTPIDFLNVDVEGLDLEVLRSNDWETYRPRFVLAEDRVARHGDGASHSEIMGFLAGQDYRLIARTMNTLICERK